MSESHFPEQFRWKTYLPGIVPEMISEGVNLQNFARPPYHVHFACLYTATAPTFTAGPSKNCCLGLVKSLKLCKLHKNNPKIPPKVSYLPFSHCLPPHWHFYAQDIAAYGQLQGPQALLTSLNEVSLPHLDLSVVSINPATILTNKGRTAQWRH